MMDATTGIPYFAYGAMVNPSSRALRKFSASDFEPAILKNYRVDFRSFGFGNVVPEDGSEVHGVLMLIHSEADWEILKGIEQGYEEMESVVYAYTDHRIVQARVFHLEKIQSWNGQSNEALPSKRYLTLIAQGLEHHGVHKAYIASLLASTECRPSRTPSTYLKFPGQCGATLPVISHQDYMERSKQHPCFLVGSLVVDVLDPPADATSTAAHPLYRFLYNKAVGQPTDLKAFLFEALHDPDLPQDDDDLQDQWAIDQTVEVFQANSLIDNFHAYARVQDEPTSQGVVPSVDPN